MSTLENRVKYCRVCGDVALNFNFGGLSCESCKLFFRRYVSKHDQMKCSKRQNCSIDKTTRLDCKLCRMNKCIEIGMNKDYFITKQNFIDCLKFLGLPKSVSDPLCLQQYEFAQIKHIKKAMSIFVNENELPIRRKDPSPFESFNMAAFYVEKTIKFCNNFYFFKNLNEQDKLIVLKPFYFELLSFKIAFIFDTVKDGFRIVENHLHDRAMFIKIDHCDHFSSSATSLIRRFNCSSKLEMENDPTLRDLIITQCLFRPKAELQYPETQNYLYKFYCRILKRYLECKYRNVEKANQKYFTLMGIMNDVENVRTEIHQIYNQIEPINLSHTMAEIYDVQ